MAEEAVAAPEVAKPVTDQEDLPTVDMELEPVSTPSETHPNGDSVSSANGDAGSKRGREEDDGSEGENGDDLKKQKVEKSMEEERLEKAQQEKTVEGAEEDGKDTGRVSLGPKSFGSSLEMFNYFYKLLHYWTPNIDLNQYEHTVLLNLLKKGHLEPDKKIGVGIHAFQVRNHPMWKSRCFFLIRDDESVDDFSFRKCVDHLLPLPEDMKVKSDVNKVLGGGGGKGRGGKGGAGGRGGGWGRRRGGKWRN